ncbi:hypothetical protein DSL72_003223 [Monilinia vaccinii-corymbosi]|uniref:Postreplication repair E3 ubiquitin-protein ligase RAD18 n=1 Tax=Monilinia vaccinii-corymbosi TaxID=61207 RepID=A0A8A3P1P9_9HELO|nr:hypothetical protein DSL72_003223 [Monilinia vaccinii-corymbosi]
MDKILQGLFRSTRENATSKTATKKSTKTLFKEAMNTRGLKDDSFEIADSTDWLNTPLAQLADVDSLLRCQVCKDFFTTPMITSCSHTFCSLCIRRCLSNDSKCPTCRSNDQEVKLKSNAVIEDLVEAFQRARPAALELARKPAVERAISSPKRKREISELDGLEDQANKRTRASTRQPARRFESAEAVEGVVVIDDADGDEDFKPDDGLTECPVCNRRMTAKSVEAHIESCLAEAQTIPQSTNTLSKPSFPSTKPAKRPDRLPVVNFSLIKDQALRKKLLDLGISAAGGREMMRKRLTEYTTIWNANCDAKNPRGVAQLKRDLESWERTLGSRAPQPSPLSAHIKHKDFDGKAWSSEHRDNFKDLIVQARQKKNKQPIETEDNEAAFTMKTPVSSQTLQGLSISDDAVDKQEGASIEIHSERKDAENASISRPQTLPELSEANNPQSPRRRFFSESAEQVPEHTMAALPSSKHEPSLTIMQAQEAQERVASTEPNPRWHGGHNR